LCPRWWRLSHGLLPGICGGGDESAAVRARVADALESHSDVTTSCRCRRCRCRCCCCCDARIVAVGGVGGDGGHSFASGVRFGSGSDGGRGEGLGEIDRHGSPVAAGNPS